MRVKEGHDTFFHNKGFFLSRGKRRWSRNLEATTHDSHWSLFLVDVKAFSSSISQTCEENRESTAKMQKSTQMNLYLQNIYTPIFLTVEDILNNTKQKLQGNKDKWVSCL